MTQKLSPRELEQLIALGKKIDVEEPAERDVEAQRAELLRIALSTPQQRRRVAGWVWAAAPIAAAAALFAVWILRPPPAPVEPAEVQHGMVEASHGAQFERKTLVDSPGAAREEVLRLRQGKVVVDVSALELQERFFVVALDATVEMKRDSRVEVSVEHDRLITVFVYEGAAEVRRIHTLPVLVGVGQRWTRADEPRAEEPVAPAPEEIARVEEPVVQQPKRVLRAAPKELLEEPPPPPVQRTPTMTPLERDLVEGWRLLRQQRYAEAAPFFERVSLGEPQVALAEDATYWWAISLARAKNTAAPRVLEQFLSRYPSSPRSGEVNVALGWLLLEQDERARARACFERAQGDRKPKVREQAEAGLRAVHGK